MCHKVMEEESRKAAPDRLAGSHRLRAACCVLISVAFFAAFGPTNEGRGSDFGFRGTTSPYGTPPSQVAQRGGDVLPGNPDDDGFPHAPPHYYSPRLEPLDSPPAIRYERPIPARNRDGDASFERLRIQRRLTSRYGNPATVQLLETMSPEQGLAFFLEVSRLIDARHLNPSSYERRIAKALKNLQEGTRNRAFGDVSGMSRDPAAIDQIRHRMLSIAHSRVVTAEDASQVLNGVMRAAQQEARIAPAAVALEFVVGATDSLDRFSRFIPTSGHGDPLSELEGHLVGMGVEIESNDDGVRVIKALPDSPAAEAGLKTGDVIESIDGRDISGATLEDAVSLIAGPEGKRLTLTVRRDNRVAQMAIIRRRIELRSLSQATIVGQNVGYIKLEKFAETSATELDEALAMLNRQGMQSLILDLRGNPGGLLRTVVELSSRFISCGPIVATHGRSPSDDTVEYSHGGWANDIPLVVLVDEQSASASEILAAAIQDDERGLIVGRRTYGKGTVQTHFPLQSVPGSLVLTTARFFSPRGRLIDGSGVEPDIEVPAGRFESYRPYRLPDYPLRSANSRPIDRDLAVALEAARSARVFEMARSARHCGAAVSPIPTGAE